MVEQATLELPNPVIACRHNEEVRVPLPIRNTVQGGAHAVIKARVEGRTHKYLMSDLAIQERHIVPMTYDMAENQSMANTIQDVAMNKIFGHVGMRIMGTCNEGGIGAFFRQWGEKGAWKVMAEAVEECGYKLGRDVCFGLDGAADFFYRGNGVYELDGRNYDFKQLMEYYSDMLDEYPIIYAEDLFASSRDAWDHWAVFNEKYGDRAFVVLDDIATTNARLLRDHIAAKTGNMLLLKMNQIGTMLEGWRAAETAHKSGMFTVSSHRSTSSVDFMETEVALALSMVRENMGRCLFAKCGGAKLIERAMRYSMAQQWVEDWDQDVALAEPLSEDVRIVLCKGYPAPLNTGSLTTGVRVKLSNGMEISAIVPAGTSTGETEACLVPTRDAVRNVNQLVTDMELVGTRIGDLPDQIAFDQQLLAFELKEAARLGQIHLNDDSGLLQIAAEMKRAMGANAILGLSVVFNRILAARKGKPSWLAYRESGEELTRRQLTFDDEAFYEPAIRALRETVPTLKPHTYFGAASRDI